MLHRLVLVARSRIDLGQGALNGDLGILLSAHMKASVDSEMTGGLVWIGEHFLDVLEGHREHLRAFFNGISQDGRIAELRSLEFLPLSRREYATWAVADGSRAMRDAAAQTALQAGHADAVQVRKLVSQCLRTGTLATSPPLAAA